jgi:HEAT repeat protein
MQPDSAPALISALTNRDRLVRLRAAASLGSPSRTKSALPPLVARLGDSDPEVRPQAALALRPLAGTNATGLFQPVVLDCLHQDDWKLRREAVWVVSSYERYDKVYKSDLIEALGDESREVRIAAASALLATDEQTAHKIGVWTSSADPRPPRQRRHGWLRRFHWVITIIVGCCLALRWPSVPNCYANPHRGKSAPWLLRLKEAKALIEGGQQTALAK